MAHIVANLPPVKCFVRKEFLYDFEKGHGELEPCWWISIKSLRGQAFRIEAYLNNYGALYDKLQLQSMRCKFKLKNGDWMYGVYLFTVDSAHPDFNIIDTGFSEDVEDHKSYNFIMCDNGQFAAQPNNRLIILEPSSNPKELKMPDFKVATKRWSVETDSKWALGDTNTIMYEVKNEI